MACLQSATTPTTVEKLTGEDKELQRLVRDNYLRIEDVYMDLDPTKRALYHRAAENLETWCTADQMEAFLSDDTRIQNLASNTVRNAERLCHGEDEQDPDLLECRLLCRMFEFDGAITARHRNASGRRELRNTWTTTA